MSETTGFSYFYIDPQILFQQGLDCKDFLTETINSYISIITCMKELINSYLHNEELENMKHCLVKLKSSIAELKIIPLSNKIDDLIFSSEGNMSKIKQEGHLKDFLMICELVVMDLNSLKENSGIKE